MEFHSYEFEEVIKKLNSNKKGLSKEEALKRLAEHGANELVEPPKDPWWKKLLNQFTDFLIIILIFAVIISAVLGEWIDSIAILVILIINAILGFVQEYRAEKALEALKKMSGDFAKVIRNGKLDKIPVKNMVAGDIFILETGDKVPADARIIESVNLKVSESILTGESEALHKVTEALDSSLDSLGDMKNCVFKDTVVMYGRGKAIAFATGMKTEVGKIAGKLLTTAEEESPLTIEINQTGKKIGLSIIFICILVFILGATLRKGDLLETFLTAISLAVAAIPEGLPAVVTIVLAMGVKRMAQEKAIMKKLHAVETLGSTTHICTDKTGTLTQNIMAVTEIWLARNNYLVTGEKYDPRGTFLRDGEEVEEIRRDKDLMSLLKIGALCNDSEVRFEEETKTWRLFGDPTEGALKTAALKAGFQMEELLETCPRINEIPFSSERAMMTTIHKINEEYFAYIKGAPEKVLEKSSFYLEKEDLKKMSPEFKEKAEVEISRMSRNALRGLAFAYKKLSLKEVKELRIDENMIESNLIFVGIVGEKDPLRLEVKQAIEDCRNAGIRPIMITGDHPLTAFAIGKELGLIKSKEELVEGSYLRKMSDNELRAQLQVKSVFARILPKDKLRIVEILKEDPDKVIAVTGDGVNDSLAIKSADIGIAMGIEGTDVTREVADMILQDDNFATIVNAVRQGRVIFANLVKFIRYLLSCNISEVLVVFLAVLIGLPIPLIPIQLLWVNLITDGIPALALGVDPAEKGVMNRAPRNLEEGILSARRWVDMIFEGLIMASCVFFVFITMDHIDLATARTATFVTLCVIQLIHSISNRSETQSIFKLGLFSNIYLVIAIVVSFLLQMVVVYTSFGNEIFKSVPLTLNEWEIILGVSLIPFIAIEIIKYVKRRGWWVI